MFQGIERAPCDLEVAIRSEPPGKQANVLKPAHLGMLMPAGMKLCSCGHIWAECLLPQHPDLAVF